MNIKDVKEEIERPENVWKAIFEKQRELAFKYKDIEKMGDLLETTENNINTAKGQKWIKDFCWRVTEELAEAQEAYDLIDLTKVEDQNDIYQHYIEEVIDALHFLTEMTIIAGYDHKIIPENLICACETHDLYEPWHIVYQLGLMCNCLKNKPWKQSQMLTDRPKFENYLKQTWKELLILFESEGFTFEDIYDYYFKKNKVNQFRIRSKY